MNVRSGLSKKLFISGLVVLFFIFLIAGAGEICIRILKKTSHLVVVEFAEMEELQNVLLETSRIIPSTYNYLNSGDPFQKELFTEKMDVARKRITSCKEILTDRHDKGCLDSLSLDLNCADSIGVLFFSMNPVKEREAMSVIIMEMERLIGKHIDRIESLLRETKQEVDNYVSRNETATLHSAITIISLGGFLILTIFFGGFFFIRKITTPSKRLLDTIQKVIDGDIKAKVTIQTHDEFGAIAEAFNQMLERIDRVTVSRNRYTHILNSMSEGVVLTNIDGTIITINRKAGEILASTEETLAGREFSDFLQDKKHHWNLMHHVRSEVEENQAEMNLINKEGNEIPVHLVVSELIENEFGLTGYVIVIRDLSEKRRMETQMAEIRKENAIGILEAQEIERLRLATDLHDGIVQILTGVGFAIENLEKNLADKGYSIQKECEKILDQIQIAISESRRISHNLIPLALHDLGLVPAIQQMVAELNHQQSISFRFSDYNMVHRADPRIEKALYRICQESINNILKHANAKNAHIQIIRHFGSIVLVIEDDGIGFLPGGSVLKKQGIGLESIRKRVEAFGGTFTINSDEGQGVELIVEIPCL